MSFYMVFSSDKSKDYYPGNVPFNFKTHLTKPLILDGLWKVAVVETDISTTKSKWSRLNLLSSICGETFVNDEGKPLLRNLGNSKAKMWSYIFDLPFYVDFKVSEIYDIDIYITDQDSKSASFIDKPTTVTLHFRAFPF